jgi:hypothetical protein
MDAAADPQTHLTKPALTLPNELRSIDTNHGTFGFEVLTGEVHGEKVYTTSNTTGGGGGTTVTGYGNGSLRVDTAPISVKTDVRVYHEFWIRPSNGGTDRKITLENNDFRVANGHTVALLFVKAKTRLDQPLMLINLDSMEAIELPGDPITRACEHVQAELVGAEPSTFLLALFLAPIIGVPYFVWRQTASLLVTGVTVLINTYLVALVLSKFKFVNDTTAKLNAHEMVKKKFDNTWKGLSAWLIDMMRLRMHDVSKDAYN